MPTQDPWFDETPAQKEVRRNAANAFLAATQTMSSTDRAAITGFDNEAAARAKFEALGGIKLPADVRVICYEPDRGELAKIVVFALLDPKKPTPAEPYREGWIAGWPPYQ